jgi:hypothetical protein
MNKSHKNTEDSNKKKNNRFLNLKIFSGSLDQIFPKKELEVWKPGKGHVILSQTFNFSFSF